MKLVHSFYYVYVPDSKKPVFPDSCVVCGKSGGEELKMVQITDDLGSVQFYFYGLGRDREDDLHLHVPIHDSCGKDVRNTFLKWFVLSLVNSGAVAALGIIQGYNTVVSLVVGGIVMGPLLSILLSKPVPFEVNLGDGKLHLKLSNRSYAEQVARLNGSEIIEYRRHVLGNEERVGPSRDT